MYRMAMEGYVMVLLNCRTFLICKFFFFMCCKKYNCIQCFISDVTSHKYILTHKDY